MKKNFNTKKGQAIIEYMGLIVIVCLALYIVSMRGYFQRVVQARWRDNVASISDIQYSTDSSYNVTRSDWEMNVRTSDGANFQRSYDPDLNCTVWYL